jgi:hypothetical protein
LSEWSNAHNSIQPPTRPERFSDTKSLAEYRRAEADYTRKIEDAAARHREQDQRFERATSQVKEVLPRDAPVEHTYQGSKPERSGTYVITHNLSDYKGIKVERVGG